MNLFNRILTAINSYLIRVRGPRKCGINSPDHEHDYDYDVIVNYHGMATHNCKNCGVFTIEDANGERLPFDNVRATKHLNAGGH